MRIRYATLCLLLLAASYAPLRAQQQPGTLREARGETPVARSADVASVDAIIAALYDVISGPKDAPRDWDRMRSLFVPGARLMPVNRRPDGSSALITLSVEDYITRVGPQLISSGFSEHEIASVSERFGDVVHVFSSYEGRMVDRAEPIRGINSIQLMHDGTRWWVVTVFWQAENADNPIPPRYLPPAR
jgi:hypothetical protein